MQVSLKRAVSFFIIVLTMFLVSLPADGLAKSKLKKCPKDQSQRYHNCFGTFTLKGTKYVGEFRNDKRHGQGTLTYPDGTKDAGTWRNGKLVKRTR